MTRLKLSFLLINLLLFGCVTFAKGSENSTQFVESCIQSVCGDHVNAENRVTPQIRNMVEVNIEKPLENYINVQVQNLVQRDKIFQFLFKDPSQIKPSSHILGFINAAKVLSRFKNNNFDLNPDRSFDKKKYKERFPGFSDEYIEAIGILIKAINQVAIATDSKNETIFLENYLRGLYPEKSIDEALISHSVKIVASREKVYQFIPLARYLSTEQDYIFTKAASGQKLNYIEKKAFNRRFGAANIEILFYPGVIEAFSKVAFDAVGFISEFKNYYQSSDLYSFIQNKQEINTLINKNRSLVLDSVANSYAHLPSQAQQENFLATYSLVLAAAKQVLIKQGYPALANQLNPSIVLQGTRESFISDAVSYLRNMNAIANNNSLEAVKIMQDSQAVVDTAFALAAIQQFEEKPLVEITNLLFDTSVPKDVDSAFSKMNMINFSWETIQDPSVGMQTVSHELGHIVSTMNAEVTKTAKDCLTEKHNSSKYAEEDYADLFSASVMKQLQYKIKDMRLYNLACGFIGRDKNPTLERSIFKLNDYHSSNLYRLIAFSAMTTGVTSQCSTYLDSVNENRFNNYCH